MAELLKLKAKHFKDADFESCFDCPIAKAAKMQLNAESINVSTTYLCLNNVVFFKLEYDFSQFKEDKIIAQAKNFSEEIVRVIELVKE